MSRTTTHAIETISEEDFEFLFTVTFDTSTFSQKDFETILGEYQTLPFKNSKKSHLLLNELRSRISKENSLLELLDYYRLCEKVKPDLSTNCEDRWIVVFKNFVNDPNKHPEVRKEFLTMVRQGKRPHTLPRSIGETIINSKMNLKSIFCG